MTHKKKAIINGKYPSYSFRLDPKTVADLEILRGEASWNKLFEKLLKKQADPADSNLLKQ